MANAQNEQFLHLSQCFQLFAVIIPSFVVIFWSFANMLSQSPATGLQYVGNGKATKVPRTTSPLVVAMHFDRQMFHMLRTDRANKMSFNI